MSEVSGDHSSSNDPSAQPLYRIGQAAELLGVSVDTVRRWADEGDLAVVRTSGGQRLVNGVDLARMATARADSPTEGRARVSAQVEIQAGPYRVVSLMTREAAEDMGLTPGVEAAAVVKSTNVVVERIGA